MIFIDLLSTLWVASRVRQNDDEDDDDDDDDIVIIIETQRRRDFDEDHESNNCTNDCTKCFVLYRNSE